jgi:hypothetical protein
VSPVLQLGKVPLTNKQGVIIGSPLAAEGELLSDFLDIGSGAFLGIYNSQNKKKRKE